MKVLQILINFASHALLMLTWAAYTDQSIGVDLSIAMTEDNWNEVLQSNPDVTFAVIHTYFYNGTINPNSVETIRTAKAVGVEEISAFMQPCIASSTFIKTSQLYCGSAEEQLNSMIEYFEARQIYFRNFSVSDLDVYSPTLAPTGAPTAIPTARPSQVPTSAPTFPVTASPTAEPSEAPSCLPSTAPSEVPSQAPTFNITAPPTLEPTEAEPTTNPTTAPTFSLNITSPPSAVPTTYPTAAPTALPSTAPTTGPTATPSLSPTVVPSQSPTISPTAEPSASPTTENVIIMTRLFVNLEDQTPNRFFSDKHYINMQFMADLVNAAAQQGIQLGVYTTRKDWFNIMADKPSRTDPYVYPTSNSTFTASNPFNHLPLWMPRFDSLSSMDFYSTFGGWEKPFMKQLSGGSTALRRIGSDRIGVNFIDDLATNGTTAYDNQTLAFTVFS